MSGIVVPVLRYTQFNHSYLSASATEDVIIADRIPVAPFTTIGLSARIHRRSIVAGASYQFIIRATNPSDEDGADFVFATDLGSTTATTGTTNPTTVPGLVQLTTDINDPQHPMIRVILRATGPSGAAANVFMIASADLVMRGA